MGWFSAKTNTFLTVNCTWWALQINWFQVTLTEFRSNDGERSEQLKIADKTHPFGSSYETLAHPSSLKWVICEFEWRADESPIIHSWISIPCLVTLSHLFVRSDRNCQLLFHRTDPMYQWYSAVELLSHRPFLFYISRPRSINIIQVGWYMISSKISSFAATILICRFSLPAPSVVNKPIFF